MSEETTEVENTEQTAPPAERDFEAEAKNLGWHNPEDEDFKENPYAKTLNAKEFIEKGESELPLLRANVKKLQKQAEENKVSRDEFRSYMESETGRQLKNQEAEFERRLREAAKDGDVEALDQVIKERKDSASTKPVVADIGVQTAVNDFQDRNAWYGVDDKMTQYAKFVDSQIAGQKLALTPEQHFKKVEKAVMEQFPKQAPRNIAPQAVEGGRKRPAGGAAKTYAAMPQTDRTACDRMASKWGIDKKNFVENYWADQEKQS